VVCIKIGIGNDHQGLKLKKKLVRYLFKKGYKVLNYGTNTEESVDYPDYAKAVGRSVSSKEIDLGILICGTGIGMSIACNRIEGARCAKVSNVKETKLAKEHNDSNVLALNGDMPLYKAKDIIDTFLKTSFTNDERHLRRIAKVDNNGN
jgi:ribose 5-phosphate isomerase B